MKEQVEPGHQLLTPVQELVSSGQGGNRGEATQPHWLTAAVIRIGFLEEVGLGTEHERWTEYGREFHFQPSPVESLGLESGWAQPWSPGAATGLS